MYCLPWRDKKASPAFSEEAFSAQFRQDLQEFFARKYGTTSCQFHLFEMQESDSARVDFTVSNDKDFQRRYVGTAYYAEDGELAMDKIIRLTW
jgi:hypothetical protein